MALPWWIPFQTLRRTGLLATFLMTAVLATDALADARIEARRHFRKGMSLIAEKKYDSGIDELEQAYAIRPHPNVLFNIARAYDDAGKSEEALRYYHRYLESGPRDTTAVAERVDELERLAARAAAVERAAQAVPVPPADRDRPARENNEKASKRIADLERRLDDAMAELDRMRATDRSYASTTGLDDGGLPDAADDAAHVTASERTGSSSAEPYAEAFVTAARRAQTTVEAPNATTVITGEEIRLSGVRSLPDLLRRVPGADVMQMGVGSANVSFRGFQQRIANKVLVLIDGRTEYQDFLGATLWSALPVGLDDIDRVEIIRGPGSALYGANAMLGVINIITKTPQNDRPNEASVLAGAGNTFAGSVRAADGAGKLRFLASAGYEQADKWSRDYDDGRPDVAAVQADSDLGLRSARGFFKASYLISEDARVQLGAGVNRLYTEVYPLGLLRNYEVDGLLSHVRGDIEVGPARLRVFWNHMQSDVGPQYEPIGQRSIRSQLTSHVLDAEGSITESFSFLGQHHFEIGGSVRSKRVSWAAYLGPLKEELHAAAFVQDEWRMTDPFRLVASYRVDRHPLLNRGAPGYAHSPRVSALYLINPEHVIRASVATAFRAPTFLESYLDIRIPAPGVNGASALTEGNRALQPEALVAYELGYRGGEAMAGLEWDIALYQNEVRRLITISGLEALPAAQSFDPGTQTYLLGRSVFRNEAGVYTARGLEVGTTLSPVDRLTMRGSVAFQRITATGLPAGEPCAPCSQSPDWKLFGSVSYQSTPGIDLTLHASYVGATTWIEREPDPSNPTSVVSLANPLGGYASVGARVAYRTWNDRLTLAVSGTQLGAAHAEHPFGNLIERRIFTSLTVQP